MKSRISILCAYNSNSQSHICAKKNVFSFKHDSVRSINDDGYTLGNDSDQLRFMQGQSCKNKFGAPCIYLPTLLVKTNYNETYFDTLLLLLHFYQFLFILLSSIKLFLSQFSMKNFKRQKYFNLNYKFIFGRV